MTMVMVLLDKSCACKLASEEISKRELVRRDKIGFGMT
jgi:hypothetical protein